jgi:LmbE family N-acetylglucosaminyl deacetylase
VDEERRVTGDALDLLLGGTSLPAAGLLVVGAHADDIEIGCGATLRRFLADRAGIEVRWVVMSGSAERQAEARASAEAIATGSPLQVMLHGFRESYFPWHGAEIKQRLAEVATPAPGLVLAPRLEDAHQDHRTIAEIVWQTFRTSLILEYEIPKYDADLGRPNLFVTADRDTANWKADHLLESFPSQHHRPWFTRDTFLALMRLRGVECAAPDGYAEAFTARKLRI